MAMGAHHKLNVKAVHLALVKQLPIVKYMQSMIMAMLPEKKI